MMSKARESECLTAPVAGQGTRSVHSSRRDAICCEVNRVKYCYECKDFPCNALLHVDRRYRAHFRMSMIENLEFIKKNGIRRFLQKDTERWKCANCGGTICCHNGICFDCGLKQLKGKKKLYRWEDD